MMILLLAGLLLAGSYLYRLIRRLQRLRHDVDIARAARVDAQTRLTSLAHTIVRQAQSQGLLAPGMQQELDELLGERANEAADMQQAAAYPLMSRLHVRLEQRLLERLQQLVDAAPDVRALVTVQGPLRELRQHVTGCRRAERATILAWNAACAAPLSGVLARLRRQHALPVPADPDAPLAETDARERSLQLGRELPAAVQAQLASLARLRRGFTGQVLALGIPGLLLVAAIVASLNASLIIPGLAAAGLLWLARLQYLRYQERVRQCVLPLMLAELQPALRFSEAGGLDTPTFNQAGVYAAADRVQAEHLLYGEVAGAKVQLSFVRARQLYRQRRHQRQREVRLWQRTVFNGLLLVVQRPHALDGVLCIQRRGPCILTGVTLTGVTPTGVTPTGDAVSPVAVDDAAFCAAFSVYAQQLVEAHSVLDGPRRRYLLQLRQQLGRVELVWRPQRVILTCPLTATALRPRLWQPVEQQLQQLWQSMQLLCQLVDDVQWLQHGEPRP